MAGSSNKRKGEKNLRSGWTTGACATAATCAAFEALLIGQMRDTVLITLPKGERPAFGIVDGEMGEDWARAGVIKDAGDDPDVTHGARILATVRHGAKGSGIMFKAGAGVGTVTREGLPIAPGEAAINPVPRQMLRAVIEELADVHGATTDVEVEISVPGGEALAQKTWNPRLGIVGGLSILGTTGIVHPFSCSAWIHSIHRGIDVAKAAGRDHVVGSTGSTSETAAQSHYDLPDFAMLDMGDFVGGMLKYLRKVPIGKLTIAGGPGKLTKLAQGHLDLHSSRSQVDLVSLSEMAAALGVSEKTVEAIANANTALEAFSLAAGENISLAPPVCLGAQATALRALRGAPVCVSVMLVDRQGAILHETDFS